MASLFRPPLILRLWSKDPSGAAVRAQTDVDPGTDLLLELKGQDRIHRGPGQTTTYDYPNPQLPRRSIALSTFTASFLLTLTTVAPPFIQRDFPNPRAAQRSVDLLTIAKSGNALTTIAIVPFAQDDWPVPRGAKPVGLSWTDNLVFVPSYPVTLKYDWPNPAGPKRNPQDWFASGLTLLTSTTAAPFVRDDWPNPRGPLRNPDHIQRTYQGILSSIVPFEQTDWPVPKAAERSIDLRTWLQTGYLEEVGKPFRQTEWPNPNPKLYSVAFGTWTDSFKIPLTTVRAPYLQTDWPVPKGAKSVAGFEVSGIALPSAVVTYPASITFDWPNPRGYQFPVSLRTWTDSFKIPLTTVVGFNQRDWPNPRGPKGVDGFTQKGLGLTVSPFRQQDWPVPLGKVSYDLRGWTDRFKLPFTGVIPFNQKDWPVPKGPKAPPDFIGRPLTFTAVVVVTDPFHQLDWPNPLIEPKLTVSFEFPAWQNFLPPTPVPPIPTPLPRAKVIKVFVTGPQGQSQVTGPTVYTRVSSNQGETQVTGGKAKTQVKGPKGRTDVSDP